MSVNNEFEWRAGMRQLGGGVEPARDLWPDIAAQMATRPIVRQNRWQIAFAMAATLVIALGAGLVAQRGNWQTLSADTRAPAVAPTALDCRRRTRSGQRKRKSATGAGAAPRRGVPGRSAQSRQWSTHASAAS